MKPLSDKELEECFPVQIDLGQTMDSVLPFGKKVPRGTKSYPTLYIDNIKGLEQLPEDGYMLVEFRRKNLSIQSNSEGEQSAGVTLECRTICLPSDAPEEAAQDLEQIMRNGFRPSRDDEDNEDEQE